MVTNPGSMKEVNGQKTFSLGTKLNIDVNYNRWSSPIKTQMSNSL